MVQAFGNYDPPVYGGIERTLRLLGEGLTRRGDLDVVTLCAAPGQSTRIERDARGTVVHAASFGRILNHRISPAYPLWLRRLRPAVMHLHYPSVLAEVSALLAMPPCPLVVTYHCDVLRRGWHRAYDRVVQMLLGRATRILVTSPLALYGSPVLQPHFERCQVQRIGIDHDRLRETERTREATRRVRAACSGPITLFVGRMRNYKGLQVLLRAMKRVPGTLVLVGRGEEEHALLELALEEGLKERVVFAGDVPEEELGGYYRAADVFAFPSLNAAEFFGQSMAEAMGCGLPAVSTRLGTGTSYLNLDGVTGLEVSPGVADELASALRRILENPEESRRFGEAARLRAASFPAELLVEDTAKIYLELARARMILP